MSKTHSKIQESNNDQLKVEFGKYIHQSRKTCGYTQQQVADALGVTAKSISCTERGETFPSYENIFRIAELLNMSLDEFVFGYRRYHDQINISEINEMLSSLDMEGRRTIVETLKTMCEVMSKRR